MNSARNQSTVTAARRLPNPAAEPTPVRGRPNCSPGYVPGVRPPGKATVPGIHDSLHRATRPSVSAACDLDDAVIPVNLQETDE